MNIFDSRVLSQVREAGERLDRERLAALESELKRMGEGALDTAGAVLDLFKLFPAARMAAMQAEYDRLVARYDSDHPRVAVIESSLAHALGMEHSAEIGRLRTERALETLRLREPAFIGFVLNEAGEPLPGVIVQLDGAGLTGTLHASTEADGFFRVRLPRARTSGEPSPAERDTSFGSSAAGGPAGASQARIRFYGTRWALLHEDPVPLRLDGGIAYREYRIAAEGRRRDGDTAAAHKKRESGTARKRQGQ